MKRNTVLVALNDYNNVPMDRFAGKIERDELFIVTDISYVERNGNIEVWVDIASLDTDNQWNFNVTHEENNFNDLFMEIGSYSEYYHTFTWLYFVTKYGKNF